MGRPQGPRDAAPSAGATRPARGLNGHGPGPRLDRDLLSYREALTLSATEDGLCGVDLEGRVTFCNTAMQTLLGRDEREMLGRRLHDLVHRDGAGHAAAECEYVNRRESRPHAFDLGFRRGDGSTIAVEYGLVAIEDDEVVEAVISFRDITEGRRAARLLRVSLEQVRTLSEQRAHLLEDLARAEERERERIAADIHDDTAQVLSAVVLRLRNAEREMTDERAALALALAADEVGNADTRLRQLMFELMAPPPGSSLRSAIESYCSTLFAGTDIAFEVRGDPSGLSAERRLLGYRLSQEALRNVLKHSRARRVLTTLETSDARLEMRISDDGIGLVQHVKEGRPAHAGLRMIRQRTEAAGGDARTTIGLDGRGSSIEIELPLRDTGAP